MENMDLEKSEKDFADFFFLIQYPEEVGCRPFYIVKIFFFFCLVCGPQRR